MGYTFHDNSKAVLNSLQQALKRAATAVGVDAVGQVVAQMQNGYGKPIRQTGTLMRDVNHEITLGTDYAKITIGNSVNYAPFVHFGTYKMPARPYLRDALEKNQDRFLQIAQEYFREAFD